MPTTDLPLKVRYLCLLARMSDRAFVEEISSEKNEAEKKLDLRTAQHCLDGTGVSAAALRRLINFFNAKLLIRLDLLQCGFSDSVFESFKTEVGQQRQEAAKNLLVSFDDKLDEIKGEEADYLCGKYSLYRRSFSSLTDIVTEVAAISKVADTNTYLGIEMFGHPSVTGGVEWFKGMLFRFGNMYSAITSCKSQPLARVRYLYFPVLNARISRHHGLVTGYSATHEEPVAARFFAERLGPDQALIEEDKKKVKRGNPDNLDDPNRPEMPEFVRDLIENNFDPQKVDVAVLMSDRDKVPPR